MSSRRERGIPAGCAVNKFTCSTISPQFFARLEQAPMYAVVPKMRYKQCARILLITSNQSVLCHEIPAVSFQRSNGELLSNLVYGMVLIRRRACMDRCDCLIRFH